MPFPLRGTLPSLPDGAQSATENALLDGGLLARPPALVEAPSPGPLGPHPQEGLLFILIFSLLSWNMSASLTD